MKPQIARIIEITFNPFILSWKMMTAMIETTVSPKTLMAFENREESSKISPVPPMEITCQEGGRYSEEEKRIQNGRRKLL
ncbi:hypothetical protein CARUB_v10024441mg [Capsella rubella]|uniref:Uncharacterized protein n=1 Tax=Capsella rubella TaxID=81985 RepID=R0HVW6_9BRAS|nr:hypothetical protein CARUB_v10024441mg [Capsella rubella]